MWKGWDVQTEKNDKRAKKDEREVRGNEVKQTSSRTGLTVLDVHDGGLEKQEDEEGVKGARRSDGREGGREEELQEKEE